MNYEKDLLEQSTIEQNTNSYYFGLIIGLMSLEKSLTEDIWDENKLELKKNSSYDVWNKSMKEFYKYFEESKIGLNSKNTILIKYAIESLPLELQLENTRLIIEHIAENIDSKEYQGEVCKVLLNELLRFLSVRDTIIEDNLEKICIICISNKNRFFVGESDLFSNLSIESQKKLIDYIYNNIDKFEGKNKIEFLNNDILKFIDKEVIFEKNNQLEEIVNSIVNENHLEDDQAKDLLELMHFYNNIKSDMDKYKNEVNNLSDMDEAKFECFIEDLKKLKNYAGILPEKYCDYLIKQKIDSNSGLNKNLEKYFEIFKIAFEDKTHYVLNNSDKKDYKIEVSSNLAEDVFGRTAFIKVRENGKNVIKLSSIEYNEENVKKLSEKNMKVIETMFHECRHALQKKHIYCNKFVMNPNEYKMLKEYIIEDYDNGYDDANYTFLYSEIDARINGAKGAYGYLKKLGLDNKKILNYNGEDFFECYRENQKLEREIYNLADLKKYKNEYSFSEPKRESVKYIFVNILKENLELLSEYPILQLEYDEKGERKSGFEILRNYEEELKEYEKNPENTNINQLAILSSLLKEEVFMDAKTILKDSRELLNFHTDNEVIKRHRDHIIENEFFDVIQINKDGFMCVYFDETKEEKEHFNELINNLNEFAKQNPEEPITKKILKEIEPFIQIEKDEQQSELEQLERIDAEVSDEERKEGLIAIVENQKLIDNEIGQ